jgi:CrcB protein
MLQTILFIGIGGFIGANTRYFISSFLQNSVTQTFPIGTLGVNVLGSFLIGFLALYFQQIVSSEYRVLVITGFLGALTTFSTFSYESVMLIEQGSYMKVALSITLNVILSLGATMGGMMIFKRFFI